MRIVLGTVRVMLSWNSRVWDWGKEEGMRAEEEGIGIGTCEWEEEREGEADRAMMGMGRAVRFACFLRILRVASALAY